MESNVESFKTASRDTQTLNLSGNMSKFYACQVWSWMKEQQSQNLLLKVDPLSTICNNKLNRQGEKLETSDKLRVFVLNMSSLPSVKAAIYEIQVLFLVLRHRWNAVQDIHFVL